MRLGGSGTFVNHTGHFVRLLQFALNSLAWVGVCSSYNLMKTFISAVFFIGLLAGARAQNGSFANNQEGDQIYLQPSVVYEAPVVYQAPVLYQMPVVYYAPVYYMGANPFACYQGNGNGTCQLPTPVSTVTVIGAHGGVYSYAKAANCTPDVIYVGNGSGGGSRYNFRGR